MKDLLAAPIVNVEDTRQYIFLPVVLREFP